MPHATLRAAMLAATIGGGFGLLAPWIPTARPPGKVASVAIGAPSVVLADLVVPQLGAPVSKALAMGLDTSAIGVALPHAALLVPGKLSAPRGARLHCFRATWFAGAALCLLDAGLVLASLVLADHVRISRQAVIVSLIVASAFLLAGLLVIRMEGQVSKICILQSAEATAPALNDLLRGLLASLITAGLAFAAIMGLVAVGFLSRIGEGFTIFG